MTYGSRIEFPRCLIFAGTVAIGLASGGLPAGAETVLPDFTAATFEDGAPIDNIYFPLFPDYEALLIAEGEDEEGEPFTEESRLSWGGAGPEIMGVQTWALRDLAYEDGLLVEDTLDYFAQDTDGNVWYFGEDVTNYLYDDDGNLIGTNDESAWIAGENGALPGWIMPAELTLGLAYFQEYAPADDALDEAQIFATGLTVVSGGTVFEDVLQILETTSLDPDAREFKYYAPGFGLILAEEDLDEAFMNPEMRFELAPIPLPATFPLIFAALGVLGLAGVVRRSS